MSRISRRSALGLPLLAALPTPAASIPRESPDFTYTLLNQQRVSVKQFRGKAIAFAFIRAT